MLCRQFRDPDKRSDNEYEYNLFHVNKLTVLSAEKKHLSFIVKERKN